MLRGSDFCPLECPGYYEPIIHTIGIISTVCNAFGIYLTLTKSKKNTRYRFCQLYVQVASLLTEFDLSIVNPAYFFFPMIGGMNCGPMREFQVKFGVTSHICITFFAFIFCLQVPALLTCFMYRHQAAAKCSPDKTWSLSKLQCLSLLFIYHMFPVLIAFSLYHSGLTMEEKKISMAINYPDCFPSLEDFTFDFYDYKLNPTFVAFGILISVYYVMAGVIGFGLAWRTGQVLNRYRYIMSARTYQLHKSSLITLTTQVTGPTLVLGIPVFTVYIVVASQMAKLHVLASTAPFFICMHSAVTTGCLIMTTSTYKTFVMKYYETVKAKLTWKKLPIVTVAASPVVNVRPIGSGIHTFF
ncbi:CBN-SRI-4 protein [Caenorhabditis brenneri]|uniref:CBN-SRI-4 protein n=1 Tax=Caenorhabditis brenneri TaxID=135651 RepID=G0NEI2_CAEBE|nr:CBN-SRI-4 protein [Caenorhabditis brenneri]